MSGWDMFANALPIFLGCLISAGITLLITSVRTERQARKAGYEEGYQQGWHAAWDKATDTYWAEQNGEAKSIDLKTRLGPYAVCTCGVITGGTTDPRPDCPFHGQRTTYTNP